MMVKNIKAQNRLNVNFSQIMNKLNLDSEEREFVFKDLAFLEDEEKIKWLNDLTSCNI